MPRRMLRDWTDSERFDGISAEAERLFTRLIMKADDYGRFHGDPRMVKAFCFPLEETYQAAVYLDELEARDLILRYEIGGKRYLAIVNYGQRLKKSVAKFPPMEGHPADWLPVSGNFREDDESFPPPPGTSGLEEKGREVEARSGKGSAAGGSRSPAAGSASRSIPPDIVARINSLRPAWTAMGELSHLERTHVTASLAALESIEPGTWQILRDYMAARLREGDGGWQPKSRIKFLETPGDLVAHAMEWNDRRPKPRPAPPPTPPPLEPAEEPGSALRLWESLKQDVA